jgi:predicted permease
MIPLVNLAAVAMLASGSGRGVLFELARNPLLLSTLAGFACNALGLGLPGFADQTLNLLAQTSLPAGLLSVGAALRIERGQGPVAAHAYWLTVKLLVLPAIAWGLARALSLGPLDSGILVLAAALPTASSAYILAVRMGGAGNAVATQITVGTIASMLTLPLWIALISLPAPN